MDHTLGGLVVNPHGGGNSLYAANVGVRAFEDVLKLRELSRISIWNSNRSSFSANLLIGFRCTFLLPIWCSRGRVLGKRHVVIIANRSVNVCGSLVDIVVDVVEHALLQSRFGACSLGFRLQR
jgi:hypothetical protein